MLRERSAAESRENRVAVEGEGHAGDWPQPERRRRVRGAEAWGLDARLVAT